MTTAKRWSKSTSGDAAHRALSVFQESLPVQLIATGRPDFKTCFPDEALSAVVERNLADAFDFLPVIGASGDEALAGVLEVAALVSPVVPEQAVRDRMQPLGEAHLLGADASILSFIRKADQQPFCFVVSGHQISGLVTLSDLQQLPVRAALFAMVTHLEMTMADVIRNRYEGEAWMERLPKIRADKVRSKLEAAKKGDGLVDSLLYTEFCDKVTILKGLPFSKGSPTSRARFEKDMARTPARPPPVYAALAAIFPAFSRASSNVPTR